MNKILEIQLKVLKRPFLLIHELSPPPAPSLVRGDDEREGQPFRWGQGLLKKGPFEMSFKGISL